jgi:hypothetical protein
VEIGRAKHGSLFRSPAAHGRQGCPACANERKRQPRLGSFESFVARANEVHKGKFAYACEEFRGMHYKLPITCPHHGVFRQTPKDHVRAVDPSGCPKCGLESRSTARTKTTEKFVSEAKAVHGGLYDYSEVKYINTKTEVIIKCVTHGAFSQLPFNHLKGAGCPKCANKFKGDNSRLTLDQFIEQARKVHGDRYGYDKVVYEKNNKKVAIECKKHGLFWQTPADHCQGRGCVHCGNEASAKTRTTDTGVILGRLLQKHEGRYSYPAFEYVNQEQVIDIMCPDHGVFRQKVGVHMMGAGCQKCASTASVSERNLRGFIRTLPVASVFNDRSGVAGKSVNGNNLEVDVYFPEHKVALELDGIYWHSNRPRKGKERLPDSHLLDKTKACEANGVRLIHYYCDEWQFRNHAVRQHIKTVLGLSSDSVFARKCKVACVQAKEAAKFLDNNHVQGDVRFDLHPDSTLGLLDPAGQLVALMVFSPVVSNRGHKADPRYWELTRYATSIRVVGGASKLLAHFVALHPEMETLVSYSDKRISQGNLYEKLGFNKVSTSRPDYMYVNGKNRIHKSAYRKERLKKLFPAAYSDSKTEREMTEELGLFRVYNCGLDKWEKRFALVL